MNVVILDDYQGAVEALRCFSLLGDHAVRVHRDTVKDVDALVARLADADAVVLVRERTRMPAELVERLPRLRLVSQTGGKALHIDVPACTRAGVAVALAGAGQQSWATAELTWALILAAMRNLPLEVERFRAGQWQTTVGRALHGRTLGIYGFGRLGKVVAGYGRAFGMRVLAWGREGSLARAREAGYETAPSKAALFSECDVLSLHVTLTEDTRGVVGPDDLARMKPDSLLVNTSRAGLIVPGALQAALAAGRPGQAAVDVYEDEPIHGANHPLLHMPNALCTPHLGYVEQDNYERLFGGAFDRVAKFFAGEPVELLNPEVLAGGR